MLSPIRKSLPTSIEMKVFNKHNEVKEKENTKPDEINTRPNPTNSNIKKPTKTRAKIKSYSYFNIYNYKDIYLKAKNNSIEEFLTNTRADINTSNDAGMTALHLAAERGEFNTLTNLINAGANINAKDIFGNTPLLQALDSKNYKAVIETLLNYGAKFNDKESNRLLQKALKKDKINMFMFLLEKGARIDDDKKSKCSLLNLAINFKNVEIIKIILKKMEANTSYFDRPDLSHPHHITAIHKAIKHDFTSIAQLLLEAGAEINVEDKYKNTPLEYAIAKGNIELTTILLLRKPKVNLKKIERFKLYEERTKWWLKYFNDGGYCELSWHPDILRHNFKHKDYEMNKKIDACLEFVFEHISEQNKLKISA